MAREIRALTRGLQLLEAANLHNGARLRDFVEITTLPKATVYRVLEHLRAFGYLRRDANDDRYFLTLRVRRLSDGFLDGGWVSTVARPLLLDLSARVGFPVAIATPYGAAMMLRDNTDAESPLAPNVYSRGTKLPLLTSATGKVYLAFCDGVTRRTLLEVCANSARREDALARQPVILEAALAQVRAQGYAFGPGAGKTRVAQSTATFAIPIRSRGRLLGCLALRYLSDHLRREAVVRQYLAPMRRYAQLIGRAVAQADRLATGRGRPAAVAAQPPRGPLSRS